MPNNGKRFTTTIKRKHWRRKLKDAQGNGYFWEYKNKIDHWDKRINGLKPPCDGVFLVGKEEHRVRIIEIKEFKLNEIPLYCLLEIDTDPCYGLKCEMIECLTK